MDLLNEAVFPLLLAIFLWVFYKKIFRPTPKKNLPPSPRGLPVLGNLHQLKLLPHHSLRALAQEHGPIMFLRFGSIPNVIISTPEAAKHVLKTHDLTFSDRPYSNISAKLLYNLKDVALAPYGEQWRQLKTIFVHQLLSNKKVSEFRCIREQEIALMVEKIKGFSSISSSSNLSDLITFTTNDIVCRSAFGRKYSEGEHGEKLRFLFTEFAHVMGTEGIGAFIPWLKWLDRVTGFDTRVTNLTKELDEFLDIMVQERLDYKFQNIGSSTGNEIGRSGEDFLDIVLRIHMDNSSDVSMDRENVKAMILDVFAAGANTIAALGEWVMSELIRHPNIMKKLQNEIREILSGKKDITENDIDKMNFLKAVVKETLRLHPPNPLLVPRAAREDVEIMGYHISAGTTIIINGWAIGRDPGSWDKPDEFFPERFLNSSIDYKGQDFQLIPFGAGRRGCPGMSFAMANNELMLVNLLHKFDWTLPNGIKGEDLDMTEGFGLSTRRQNPLLAVATPIPFY